MKINNKFTSGLILVSVFVAGSAFAMETIATGTMKDKMEDKGTFMPEAKMMVGDKMMKDDKMMMKDDAKMKMMMAVTKSSSRSEVTMLQQHLVTEGYLVMPKGIRMGYYGALTRAAYAKYMEKMKMMGDKMMK